MKKPATETVSSALKTWDAPVLMRRTATETAAVKMRAVTGSLRR